jgi:hypothetical protein
VVEGAGLGQCEGPVVQGPGLRELRETFVERADLLNRPLRTRMVGGVGAGGSTPPATRFRPHFATDRETLSPSQRSHGLN